jgi:glycine dehydrogenase subunit 1
MLAGRRILAGVPASRLWPGEEAVAPLLLVAATEMTTDDDIAALGAALAEVLA